MTDKSRIEFEAWWSMNMFIGEKCFADEQQKRRCFRAWQASRAAIKIELPDTFSPNDCGDEAVWVDVLHHEISKHAIRIKGESS